MDNKNKEELEQLANDLADIQTVIFLLLGGPHSHEKLEKYMSKKNEIEKRIKYLMGSDSVSS